MKLRFGISTCPNDTFAFHALLTGKVLPRGLEIDFLLADVEELNQAALAGELDAAKVSFAAALRMGRETVVLPVGSALGFGNGPLLLASRADTLPAEPHADGRAARVLCPGAHTTANLLYDLFHPGEGAVEQVIFSDIMPALSEGTADFGVCIHEGRFTYREQGLTLVEDLGETWERTTRAPLPLGGLIARTSLGPPVIAELCRAIGASLDYGHAHRAETYATMARYAVELEREVIDAHVDLYVNERTRDLGTEGRAALRALSDRALALDRTLAPLEVFES